MNGTNAICGTMIALFRRSKRELLQRDRAGRPDARSSALSGMQGAPYAQKRESYQSIRSNGRSDIRGGALSVRRRGQLSFPPIKIWGIRA